MILFIFFASNSMQGQIVVNLDNYGHNKIHLPLEMIVNGEKVKKDFVLLKNETHAFQQFDIEKLRSGIVDTSFKYYPITIKKGNINLQNTSFQIGLIDENRNNSFTDIGLDKLIFLPFNTDSIYYFPSTYAATTLLNEKTYAKINNTIYQIEPSNNEIVLIETTANIDSIHCVFNPKIPKIIVQNEDGLEVQLSEFKEPNKNLIVELWFNGCRGCIKALPKLKEIDTSKNVIVSLNVIDDLSAIKQFKEKKNIYWPMIKAEKEVLKELGNLGDYPSAVVYDKNGILLNLFKSYE